MELSLNKLSWPAQLGVIAVLAAAALGAFWHFYVVPAEQQIDARQVELQGLEVEVVRGAQVARRLPEFRSEVSALEGQLDRLRVVLPEEKDVADLLRRIQAMATESNLTIRGFTPQAVASKEMYAEWPIGLQLEGTYHDLGGFLERISRFPRIINVTSIAIRSKDGAEDGTTISAECTATTFVMADPAPAAAGGVAPAKTE